MFFNSRKISPCWLSSRRSKLFNSVAKFAKEKPAALINPSNDVGGITLSVCVPRFWKFFSGRGGTEATGSATSTEASRGDCLVDDITDRNTLRAAAISSSFAGVPIAVEKAGLGGGRYGDMNACALSFGVKLDQLYIGSENEERTR